jgi:hypothetical protein
MTTLPGQEGLEEDTPYFQEGGPNQSIEVGQFRVANSQVALDVIMRGVLPTEGEKEPVKVSTEERLKALRDCMRYLLAPLSAVQITGANQGPLFVETLDVTRLMMNPELAAAAQKLALGIAGAQPDEKVEP